MSGALADNADLHVAPAEIADLKGMAGCHRACFPHQFTTCMGPRFARAFYQAFLEAPEGIALVAVASGTGEVVGLVAGGTKDIRARFLASVPRRFPLLLARKCVTDAVVQAAVLRELWSRISRTRQRRRGTAAGEKWGLVGGNTVLLQVIGVLPRYRGEGVAARLVTGFREACRRRAYETMILTVASDNLRAVAFYRKDGWKTVDERKGSLLMQRPVAD